jgi:DNA polymerase-4
MTFKRDLYGEKDIFCAVTHLSESIAARMRSKGVKCTVVQVTIKNPDLVSIQRQEKLDHPTNLAKEIALKAMELVRRNWIMSNPIRMLTVTGGGIVCEEGECQLSFFEESVQDPKQERLEKALDTIRDKYGKEAIQSANIIKNDIGI